MIAKDTDSDPDNCRSHRSHEQSGWHILTSSSISPSDSRRSICDSFPLAMCCITHKHKYKGISSHHDVITSMISVTSVVGGLRYIIHFCDSSVF